VFAAIHEGRASDDVLAIKYLETLAKVADGQATKVFLPVEAMSVLGALGGLKDVFAGATTGAAAPAALNGAPAEPPA
jgi:hypothetical protein